MRRIYDISVPIAADGVVYPGNPEIRVTLQQAVAKGASANVSELHLGSHTGTHVDAPRHFDDFGKAVDELPLEQLMGRALVIEFPEDVRSIGEAELKAQELEGQERVLLKTRNSSLLRRPEFVETYTYLAPDGAAYLLQSGVRLVGIDYYSIEQFRSGHHRTHSTLLNADVVIVEGLDLSAVPAGEYELVCLPLRLQGLDGAPARAVLLAE